MTSPFFKALEDFDVVAFAFAEFYVAPLGLGIGVVGIDQPDVVLVGVVFVVVNGLFGHDDRVGLVVRGDAYLAAHAGDDPSGDLILVHIEIDFEFAGAYGDRRNRLHFAATRSLPSEGRATLAVWPSETSGRLPSSSVEAM